MNRTHLTRSSSRGIAMAFVVLIIFVLIVIGFALGSRGTQNLDAAFRSQQKSDSYFAAMAGVSRSLYGISQNDPALPACGSGGAYPANPTTLADNATFSATVYNNYSNNCNATMVENGTTVPPGTAFIVSTGARNGVKSTAQALVSVTFGWPYPDAVVGKDGVHGTGNGNTDSYNSNNGPYGPGNEGRDGNVATDANTNGSVSLTGNSTVDGTVYVGSGGQAGPPTITTTGNAGCDSTNATGTACTSTDNNAITMTNSISFPPLNFTAGGSNVSSGNISPGSYNNLSISGNNSATLVCSSNPAKFYFNSVSTSGNGKLIIDHNTGDPNACTESNPARLYVVGNVSFTGNGVVNIEPDGTEAATTLIVEVEGTSVSVTGNGTTAMALYAPNATINITGNGDVFGSYVGKVVNMTGNGAIHRDDALTGDQFAGTTPILDLLSESFH